jgi:hypothetical protein
MERHTGYVVTLETCIRSRSAFNPWVGAFLSALWAAPQAQEMIRTLAGNFDKGVQGGIIVHLGCGDGN